MDKIAVVTGGTRGIGASIVEHLVRSGWRVVVIARHIDVKATSSQLETVSYVAADLSVEQEVYTAAREIAEQTSHLDLVVNNAGAISSEERLDHITYESFERSIRLHLSASLFLTRKLRPLLAKGNSPSIINVGSVYGDIADPEVAGYCLAKSAIPLLTQMMSRSYAPSIRANCILPGHIDTAMTRGAPAAFIREVQRRTPLERIGAPAEVAEAVLFLASSGASFINGAAIRIDGGFMCTPNSVM